MNKALQILKKKNYVVRVDKIEDFKYKVTYPPFNIYEKKFDSFSKEYSFEYEDNKRGGVRLDGEFLELPFYLRRLAIIVDIYSQCNYAQINQSLICYFDAEGNEKKDFFELTGNMLENDPEGLTKEQTIYKMLVGQDVPIEEQIKVFRAWKLMKGLSL